MASALAPSHYSRQLPPAVEVAQPATSPTWASAAAPQADDSECLACVGSPNPLGTTFADAAAVAELPTSSQPSTSRPFGGTSAKRSLPPSGSRTSPASSLRGLSLRRAQSGSGNPRSRADKSQHASATAGPAHRRLLSTKLCVLGTTLLAAQLIWVVAWLVRPNWLQHWRHSDVSSRSLGAQEASWSEQLSAASTVDIIAKLAAQSRKGATPAASGHVDSTHLHSRGLWPVEKQTDAGMQGQQMKQRPQQQKDVHLTPDAAQSAATTQPTWPAVTPVGMWRAAANTEPKPFAKGVEMHRDRVANPPPITGVVFYGRRSRVRILDCYLQRNMARHGGLLHRVVFVTATWEAADSAFLDRLVALRAPDYTKLVPQRLDRGYTGHYAWMDPGSVYVKIDDDVLFIADTAVDHMLAAHNLNRYHLISANVINHQPLELPHSQRGAHSVYEQARPGDRASWALKLKPVATPTDANNKAAAAARGASGASKFMPVPYVDDGWQTWGDWQKAANVHYSFLANHAAGRLGLYEFPGEKAFFDFHAHFGYTRWRINMIMFRGSSVDVHKYNMSSTVATYPGDDEDFITRILPQQLNMTSAAASRALAVHFSFYPQRAGLENSTDLLDRYALLAQRTCGPLVSAE